MSLFSTVAAPEHDRWRIIVGGADEVLPTIRGAAMVHADPPWSYFTAPTAGQNAGDHYDTITMQTIAAHVAALYACGTDDAHLVLWSTWPKLAEWMAASAAMPWAYVSGGAWAKDWIGPRPAGVAGACGLWLVLWLMAIYPASMNPLTTCT